MLANVRGWIAQHRRLTIAIVAAAGVVVLGVGAAVTVSVIHEASLQRVVPALEGMSPMEADDALGELDLRADIDQGDTRGLPDEFRVIVSQNPAAGATLRAGDAVDLRVQPVDVTIPDLIGLTLNEAKAAASKVHLEIAGDWPVSASTWIVGSQSRDAGGQIQAGSSLSVDLVVPEVVVPMLTGLTRDAAEAAVGSAHLEASFTGGGQSTWLVATQEPAPGTTVAYGDTITMTLVAPPPPEIVFEVTGNGSTALVTWVPPRSFSISQDTGAALPWRVSFPWYGGTDYGNFNAQITDGDTVTCRIIADGRVVREATSNGQYAVVSCG